MHPRFIQIRIEELRTLGPDLLQAAARASASDRQNLAQAYRRQYRAAMREHSAWLRKVRAVQMACFCAAILLFVSVCSRSVAAALTACSSTGIALLASLAPVPAWQKEYFEKIREEKKSQD